MNQIINGCNKLVYPKPNLEKWTGFNVQVFNLPAYRYRSYMLSHVGVFLLCFSLP